MKRDTDLMDQHRVYVCPCCMVIQKAKAANRKCSRCGKRGLCFIAKVFVAPAYVVEVHAK